MNPWQKLVSMEKTDQVLHELEKKYHNCYIKYTNKAGKAFVLLFRGFNGTRFKAEDKHGAEILFNYENDHTIENLVIKPGLYQAQKAVVFGQYTGARQYKKSINKESFVFKDPFYDEKAHHYDLYSVVFDVLDQDYCKSIKHGVTTMLEDAEYRGIAINRNFGIYRFNQKLYYLYRNAVIGYFDGNVLRIENKYFNQEVMDSHRVIDYSEFEVIYG